MQKCFCPNGFPIVGVQEWAPPINFCMEILPHVEAPVCSPATGTWQIMHEG